MSNINKAGLSWQDLVNTQRKIDEALNTIYYATSVHATKGNVMTVPAAKSAIHPDYDIPSFIVFHPEDFDKIKASLPEGKRLVRINEHASNT